MSYTKKVGDMTIFVNCVSNPERIYEIYYKDIEKKIVEDGTFLKLQWTI